MSRRRRVVLTHAALEAAIASVAAHLAGMEGEGDLADVRFSDLQRACDWLCEDVRFSDLQRACDWLCEERDARDARRADMGRQPR